MTVAAPRRCRSCKTMRPYVAYATPRARSCDDCKAAPGPPRPCRRCGKTCPASAFVFGGRACEDCRATPPPSNYKRRPRACCRCHVVKEPDQFAWGAGRGAGAYRRRKGVCRVCDSKQAEATAARVNARRLGASTWEQDGVLVRRCAGGCGVIKPLSDFYVDHYRADGTTTHQYHCKKCQRARVAAYHREAMADPERREHIRQQRNLYQARFRERHPDQVREYQRGYQRRLKADRVRYARYLEGARISYRLRRERDDHIPLDQIRYQPATGPKVREEPGRRLLLARPLHDALLRLTLEQAGTADMHLTGARKVVCERAGVSERDLYAWGPDGERSRLKFDVADRVLTRLGWMWFDVWRVEDDPAEHAVAARGWLGPDDVDVAA